MRNTTAAEGEQQRQVALDINSNLLRPKNFLSHDFLPGAAVSLRPTIFSPGAVRIGIGF